MKPIEDVFSSDTFRRVVLPGIILTAGIHPLIMKFVLVGESLYGISALGMLASEVVIFGLAVSSAIQWVFYVYEGFRLSWLTRLALHANERRVEKLSEVVYASRPASLSTAQRNALYKSYEHLRDFPIRRDEDGNAERFADRSTLLGNIIATYELYAQATYGIDGVFYWYHILNFGPESLRKDFADQIAFVESLVLTSFAGFLVALVHAFVLLAFAIGLWSRRFLILVSLSFDPRTSVCLLLFGIAVWILFYWAALQPSRDASKIFRALVDIAMPSFAEWLPNITPTVNSAVAQKAKTLRTYLRGD